MDWTESFVNAINYIEEHLLEDISTNEVASSVFISPFYFQKVFSIYTGYSVSEYIRSRRLYQAAVELKSSNKNIIDIAYKYGYDTPESFSKAFYRFHGVMPSKAKEQHCPIKIFLPLRIRISIEGGNVMDYVIEEEKALKFIGFVKEIPADNGYIECPKFWDDINDRYFSKLNDNSEISKAIKENGVGEFAVCYDEDGKTFKYMIGGLYKGNKVPDGMQVLEFPTLKWAKFKCHGPLPGALQTVNSMIWKEWIPNNPKYELALNADIEWYSSDNISDDNYQSAIWLPIKEK